ncbi:hypothetical protein BO83DRAFT_407964 [Aspergillus eucalypticola CBS 122712]|uniref:Protein NO VEIN C-terminal domain-containing protein n=1 Tax=Aspergillus eucalypticola (strain CBS 122712 / IBT 29274) TaxID=1448314 RepID=A0A317VMA4_ASPEC|nr:uncharacterized protein BO83DRAFT_407964 [Aspergillus eucalypticola CBS 122712]PWY74068.1 hypothetical protein BO83DRAFT_407964 [Aspergillus eucalypticola CBS 122712]
MSDPVTGRERARKLVQGISERHGYLGEDVLSLMSDEVRRQVEEAMLRKDEMIGSSVVTLSKNLYNSSARFVFELVQNADDNHYTVARGRGTVPSLAFHVYPRRIVVDCNEDGFTHENLVAICDVGRSSKTGAQGYIGEKGIGFKSVFMVAWKVQIQSGDFSFSFRHKPGGSGMGMISPIWEDVEEQLQRPMTQITLYLHEDTAPRETAMQQFHDLQDTLLLFTKNLQRLEVSMYDDNEEQISSTVFAISSQNGNHKVLRKTVIRDGTMEELARNYHLTKYIAHGLPRSENRTYTDEEEGALAYSRADTDIILAFPVSQDFVPIIEPQDVFAFLPVRSMGFTFLIHSDFVTDASRQDIVRSSARNRKLRTEIANAFNTAILEMCKHPALRYTWMRYLPKRDGHHWDLFWVDLLDELKSRLISSPIIQSRTSGLWYPIEQMRRLWDFWYDKSGDPLFPDLPREQYISAHYAEEDIARLMDYGLSFMAMSDMIARARMDLQSTHSKMKNRETSEDWHSLAAAALSHSFRLGFDTCMEEVKALPLIPLATGKWVSIKKRAVYLSSTSGVEIPSSLGIDLVTTRAASNPQRKQLFKDLGVQQAPVDFVRKLIKEKSSGLFATPMWRERLLFLYFTERLGSTSSQALLMELFNGKGPAFFDHKGQIKQPKVDPVYFPNDDPYGAKALLEPIQGGAPGLNVSFINEEIYLRDPPSCPPNEQRTWIEWLQQVFHVRETVSLIEPRDCLSKARLGRECLYVAQHRPEKFMGLLLTCWAVDGSRIIRQPELVDEIRKIKVLCENGSRYPLGSTYIPMPDRRATVSRFLKDQKFFPWLQLDQPMDGGSLTQQWIVLTKALDFGHPKSQTHFYLDILNYLDYALQDGASEASQMFDLYVHMQMECHANPSAADAVRDGLYKRDRYIWIPPHTCANLDYCLWEAPHHMASKYPLKALFTEYCRQNQADAVYLKDFFQKTLKIPDVRADDLVVELAKLKSDKCSDFDQISSVYLNLHRMFKRMSPRTLTTYRKRFSEDALIYVPPNWYTTPECLWSTATSIPGRIALNDHYQDLQELFVHYLEVQTLTMQMVVEKLRDQGRAGSSSVAEVKSTIWTLNSLLQGQQADIAPAEQVVNNAVFPVRFPHGGVQLQTAASAFAIADRKHLFSYFSSKANLLDFEVDEVPRLEPFIQWTGLNGRYLSLCIKEITMVGGDHARDLSNPDRDISQKAHGLLRVAVHLKSPRVAQDEDVFYAISMKETNGISSELHLNQDGRDIKVEVSRSELHLDDRDGQLTVYIPQDKRTQEICFLGRIPLALLQWMMTNPLTQITHEFSDSFVTIIQTLLHAKSKYVSDLLDLAGIMSIARADDTVVTAENESQQTQEIEDQQSHSDLSSAAVSNSSIIVQHTPQRDGPAHTPPRPRQGSWVSETTVVSASMRSLPVARPSPVLLQNYTNTTADPEYYQLLSSVLASARNAIFPSQGTFDMAGLDDSITSVAFSETIRLRASDQFERDFKVGAAGELFVFELLSRLDPPLPVFTRDNWQSVIRKFVTILPEYSDMTAWHGRETADITYDDQDGVLTSLFIDKGYLRDDVWRGKTPRFYIEVKSSTADNRTPFFMSKYQYRRMQEMSNGETQSDNMDMVYVIFRVYNLGQQGMRMKIYVDPEMMRVREELIFTAEGWSVVPA